MNTGASNKAATLILAFIGFFFCFASGTFLIQTAGPVGAGLRQVIGIVQDPSIQPVLVIALGIYAVGFVFLRRKLRLIRDWFLGGLLFAGIMAYAFNYSAYSVSIGSLNLCAGMTAGLGTAAWVNWRHHRQDHSAAPLILIGLLIPLFVSSLSWDGFATQFFHYQSHLRRCGPWDNPNTYGLLTGLGVVLTTGLCWMAEARLSPSRKHRYGWIILLSAICVMPLACGCFQSYSRGGWLGAGCGLAYLTFNIVKSQRRSGGTLSGAFRRSAPLLGKNAIWVVVIGVAAATLLFWEFRQTDWYPVRRALSFSNRNDFSWHNRVIAWEKTLAIMWDHPWLGVGWNLAEQLYKNYYLPVRLTESGAILTNDYLMLGAFSGIPALACLLIYVALALKRLPANIPGVKGEGTPRFLSSPGEWALERTQATCRAGAIVLLVGFWFDGGLLQLTTAVVFWVLLELGADNGCRGGAVARESKIAMPSTERRKPALMRSFNIRISAAMMSAVCLVLATAWAARRDPFRRIEFSLETSSGKMKGMVVLPKPAARFPVVIYVHGARGDLMRDGKPLRQIAELGLAAVGIEYDQSNEAQFNVQFASLQNFIQHQPWAQSHAAACVGTGLGAQRMLHFIRKHPDIEPQLLVCVAPGSGGTSSAIFSEATNSPPGIHLVLVRGENDEAFSLANGESLARPLDASDISATARVLSGAELDFGGDSDVTIRQTAEYCRAHLPLADYTATLRHCELNEVERQRFNVAMLRAGEHRRELWKAVASSSEPDRRTLMMIIGGLEDYDLAHAKASYLRENVHLAWRARATYPWCRNLPLEIFEKYVAVPRFFQEPVQNWRPALERLARHEVKYCRTTQEASDKVWNLMNEHVIFDLQESAGRIAPLKILAAGRGDCLAVCLAYAATARSVGLAARITRIIWQNSLGEHFCVEVWSVEDHRWHEIDVSAGNRAFDNDWVMRVPKAAILAPTGDRGLWDGLTVGRWSSFSNTISLVYPSGGVLIKVLDHGVPAPDRTVGIKLPTVKGLEYVAVARTGPHGEAFLTLGKSAQYPYLFFVLPPEEAAAASRFPFPFLHHDFGEETWQWGQVQSGRTNEIILDVGNRLPFNPDMNPPALKKPL